jgi:hypothetical protein
VVYLYHEGFSGPDEVGPPVVYCFDHSEELKVMSIVVLFGGGEGGRVVGHWMVLPQGSWLHSFILGEDSPNSVLRCVGLKVEYFAKVRLS